MSDNPPICFSEKEIVARKEHFCCECCCKINKGDKYILTKGIWKDGPASYKTCQACYKVYGMLEDPPDFGYLYESLSGEFPYLAKEYLEFYKRRFSEKDYLYRLQELKDEGYRIKGDAPCLDWCGNLILEERADVFYGDKVISLASLVDIYNMGILEGEVYFVIREYWDERKENKYIEIIDCAGRIDNIPAHYAKKCGSCEDCSYYEKCEFSSYRKSKTIEQALRGFGREFSCSKWKISKAWVKSELKKFNKKCEEFYAHNLFY
jgi:hypothetical protein